MTHAEALARAVQRLTAAGVPDAALDARRILAHAAGIDPGRLTLHLAEALPEPAAEAYAALVARRAAREPVSHLTGRRAFYGRAFEVSAEVLDPRPETEVLIEAALAQPFSRILDLGTGSGCIILTLLSEEPGATGVGLDLSPGALAVARRNAAALGLGDRAAFRLSDWTGALHADEAESFDLIVSNPPYIAGPELWALEPEVRDHEPRLALDGGEDGLDAYRAILHLAPQFLAPGGRIVLEIGAEQAFDVTRLVIGRRMDPVAVIPDLDGRDRVIVVVEGEDAIPF